jgi:Cu/Zn superoxide dismutase
MINPRGGSMLFTPRTIGSLIAISLSVACAEQTHDPVAATNAVPSFTNNSGGGSDRQLYQVRLGAEPGYQSHGIMKIVIDDGYITATVHAAGLMPGHHIPQHIHLNPTCNPGGGILLNLDAGLTVPGEGAGTGTAYPLANQGGVINYEAQRSLTDLLAAVNTYQGANLATVDELLAWLNLEERNGHMHVAMGPPFPAVSCGEVERRN